MLRSDSLETINNVISKTKNAIISTHTNPDGDALGSALALMFYLKQMGKSAIIINDTPTPSNYKFMPGVESIMTYERATASNYFMMADTIFIVDLNDSKRLKSVEESVVQSRLTKVLIDHHLDPKPFCKYNYVNTEASSTGQLVWEIINYNHDFKMNFEIAQNLYVAIMTDSGGFRFPRTTGDLHRITASLIDSGADPVTCYDLVYNQNTIGSVRLLGEALSKMEMHFNNKLCLMAITRNQMVKNNCKDEDIDNFVDKTLTIEGVQVGIMMAEMCERDEVRISIRSKGDFPARDIATDIGGGGHFHAAGARLFNHQLNDGIQIVLEACSRVFRNYQDKIDL